MKSAVFLIMTAIRPLVSCSFQASLELNAKTARKHSNRSLPSYCAESDYSGNLDVETLEDKLNAAKFQKLGESVYRALLSHTYRWARFLGPALWDNERGIDVTVEWTDHLSRATAVKTLLGPLHRFGSASTEIEECMHYFECFCQITGIQAKRYTARLVASRGTASTKCPQWHVDHVKVRWIQALLGPGCMWVDDHTGIVHWDRINGLELQHRSVGDRNKLIVPDMSIAKTGRTGEPLLLFGNKWAGSLKPALHKSPTHLLPWQKRVLLTMDVHC